LNGDLFIGGVNGDTLQNWCVRSSNARTEALLPPSTRLRRSTWGGNIVAGKSINPDGIMGQIFLAVDRSGASTNNNVYMLASVTPFGFGTGSDVMFVRSTNGGQSFSSPKRINDDPVITVSGIGSARWRWRPNGRIDAVWLDTPQCREQHRFAALLLL